MAVMRAFLGHAVWLKMAKTLAPADSTALLHDGIPALCPPSLCILPPLQGVTAHVTVAATNHMRTKIS